MTPPGDASTDPCSSISATPLVIVAGPTASGKSALAVLLAEEFGGEVISCDSVAVYCGMDIGSAKPSRADRMRVPHHCLDLLDPDEPCTAGDYARIARATLADVQARGRLPVIAGGTGLYLRALLEGLAPAPPRDEALRARLRVRAARRGSPALHRLLHRFDPQAAQAIHPNDTPKLIRSLEVTLLARKPQRAQWRAGRDPLRGFRVLRLGLDPPRAAIYARINERAARMFREGLLEEAKELEARFGPDCHALQSLGYTQALAVLHGHLGVADAMTDTQAGHRHYAKRQLTWFRREPGMHWLHGFGDEASVASEALALVRTHLRAATNVE